ncbi:MAG: arginine repressor [Actinobacteria bacterium]|jgi:transcriptional regulator of arginine metabolism|nr:arginine repressor [Actinomycetota bacterium]MCL5885814.1 arginine repressor [Actinomycetota bacterium]
MKIGKQERQKLIIHFISESKISSQQQLATLLHSRGIPVTQSTLSRDLEEIGVAKVRDQNGDPIYTVSSTVVSISPPEEALRKVLREWVAKVEYAGNIVVLHTPPGCAHVVAAALDRAQLEDILGTVAGDDTIFIVSKNERSAGRIAGNLNDASGLIIKYKSEE